MKRFCLVSSAKRDDRRLISVVLGTSSDEKRSSESVMLLDYGFRFYDTYLVYQAGSVIAKPRVWFGSSKSVPVGVSQDLYVTTPTGQFQKVKTTVNMSKNIKAPITKGQVVGEIVVTLNGEQVKSQPLVALVDNPKGGFFRRLIDYILHLFHGWFATENGVPVESELQTVA